MKNILLVFAVVLLAPLARLYPAEPKPNVLLILSDDHSYTQAALQFLDTHRGKPSLAYLAHNTVHTKVEAPERLIKKYADKGYKRAGGPQPRIEDRPVADFLAMIEYLDESIGVLLAGIKRLQLGRETLVIFMSDNGGLYRVWDNSPFRRGKGSEYEGGIRVPLLVHWPERIKAGQEIDQPVHVVDLFPTLMEIAGGNAGAHRLDGKSLLPLIDGRGGFEREATSSHVDHLGNIVARSDPSETVDQSPKARKKQR